VQQRRQGPTLVAGLLLVLVAVALLVIVVTGRTRRADDAASA
jgi:hypothetical protein